MIKIGNWCSEKLWGWNVEASTYKIKNLFPTSYCYRRYLPICKIWDQLLERCLRNKMRKNDWWPECTNGQLSGVSAWFWRILLPFIVKFCKACQYYAFLMAHGIFGVYRRLFVQITRWLGTTLWHLPYFIVNSNYITTEMVLDRSKSFCLQFVGSRIWIKM